MNEIKMRVIVVPHKTWQVGDVLEHDTLYAPKGSVVKRVGDIYTQYISDENACTCGGHSGNVKFRNLYF